MHFKFSRKIANSFSKSLYQYTFPPVVYGGPCSPMFSSTLGTFKCLYFGFSVRWKPVSLYFDLPLFKIIQVKGQTLRGQEFENKTCCNPGPVPLSNTPGDRVISEFKTFWILKDSIHRCHELVPLPAQFGPAERENPPPACEGRLRALEPCKGS